MVSLTWRIRIVGVAITINLGAGYLSNTNQGIPRSDPEFRAGPGPYLGNKNWMVPPIVHSGAPSGRTTL